MKKERIGCTVSYQQKKSPCPLTLKLENIKYTMHPLRSKHTSSKSIQILCIKLSPTDRSSLTRLKGK